MCFKRWCFSFTSAKESTSGQEPDITLSEEEKHRSTRQNHHFKLIEANAWQTPGLMERALTCSDSESYSSSSPLIDKAMTALSHRSWTAKKTNMAEQASCSAYPSSNAFARSHTHCAQSAAFTNHRRHGTHRLILSWKTTKNEENEFYVVKKNI